jgi:predicted metalloprotease with PDZ domain
VLEEKPGRKERSITDTSWDTWFGGAAGGPAFSNSGLANNLANTNYSYYDGGQVLGFLLDLEIRNATGNRKSLDDWMRLMYERYALPKPGFTPEQAVEAASEVAGKDMRPFFSKFVNGFDPLPYERDLAYGGINVETKARPQPWIGAVLEADGAGGGRASITNIIPGSPAEADGLDRGDVVIAVNGAVVDRAGFEKALAASKQGEKLALTVSHLGKVRELAVTVGKSPYFDYGLKPMENRSGAQDAIYQSYFGVK